MKLKLCLVLISILLIFTIIGCSEESSEANETPALPSLEEDIVGNWTSIDNNSGQIWQFKEDGTFIDTENVSFQYRILTVGGIDYLAFDREGLNIELNDADREELERVVGRSDFIPIYEATMTSVDSLILDPAASLYGSDSYFNFTFGTLILRRI